MRRVMASLAEILESEQFISRFFERSPVGLAVLDKNFRYRMLNPYLAASHKSPAECHLGKHLRQILGNVAPPVESAMKKVFLTAQPVLNCEIAGALPTRPDGGHWVASYFPMADADGSLNQVAAVVVELAHGVQLQHATDTASANAVLRSWKEIAKYVRTSVKTAQRWEHVNEFPVRRVTPNKGSVVFAFQEEIDDWLQRRTLHAESLSASAFRKAQQKRH